MKAITISLDCLEFARDDHTEKYPWWNYDKLYETWKALDIDPNMSVRKLPLFPHRRRIGETLNGVTPSDEEVIEAVNRHRRLYLDIKQNGYSYDYGYIVIRIEEGRIYVGDGHHRVSILRHLGHTTIICEVRGVKRNKD